jgi:hypothetical protein
MLDFVDLGSPLTTASDGAALGACAVQPEQQRQLQSSSSAVIDWPTREYE